MRIFGVISFVAYDYRKERKGVVYDDGDENDYNTSSL